MAVTLTARFDDVAPQAAALRLEAGARDLAPLMDLIGTVLVNGAVERIGQTNVAPDGAPWPKSLRAQLEQGKTLHDSGQLMRSITHVAASDQVEVGSNMIYAGVHQKGAEQGEFGAAMGRTKATEKRPWSQDYFFHLPWGDIPARPYLGVSEEERAEIEELSVMYFSDLLDAGSL